MPDKEYSSKGGLFSSEWGYKINNVIQLDKDRVQRQTKEILVSEEFMREGEVSERVIVPCEALERSKTNFSKYETVQVKGKNKTYTISLKDGCVDDVNR